MSITTVVFDFGNVVGFFDHGRAARRLAAFTHLPPEQIVAAYVGTDLEDVFEAGRITTEEFRRTVRELCHLRCTDEEFDAAVGDIFWPNPHVTGLLPRLKDHYRLLLLSNTNDIHTRWFRRQFADALAHFDHLVLSHEVGARKPSPNIYQACQDLARAEPQQCVFIDDLEPNVAAARARGWHGIVYRGGDLVPALIDLGIRVADTSDV